jgi:hypothetical protein
LDVGVGAEIILPSLKRFTSVLAFSLETEFQGDIGRLRK